MGDHEMPVNWIHPYWIIAAIAIGIPTVWFFVSVSEADVIIVAARLRGLNALKEDYGQIQHEKVRKALEALSDTSTTREGK
jgi:hypothetical protein